MQNPHKLSPRRREKESKMTLYEGIVLMSIKPQEEFTSKDENGNTVQMVRFDDNVSTTLES